MLRKFVLAIVCFCKSAFKWLNFTSYSFFKLTCIACKDTGNVEVFKNTYKNKDIQQAILIDITFILKKEKFKIAIEPIMDKQTNTIKYYVLKTAFYMK